MKGKSTLISKFGLEITNSLNRYSSLFESVDTEIRQVLDTGNLGKVYATLNYVDDCIRQSSLTPWHTKKGWL